MQEVSGSIPLTSTTSPPMKGVWKITQGLAIMGVRQFNVQYSLPEDRLVLRFATDDDCEYALWFTRYITRGFILSIAELVSRSRPESLQSEAALAPLTEAKEVPRREGGEAYAPPSQTPMGALPLLVTELNVSAQEDGIQMVFGFPKSQHLTVVLPQPTVEAMVAMLQDIQAKIDWGLKLDERPTPIVLGPNEAGAGPLH